MLLEPLANADETRSRRVRRLFRFRRRCETSPNHAHDQNKHDGLDDNDARVHANAEDVGAARKESIWQYLVEEQMMKGNRRRRDDQDRHVEKAGEFASTAKR